MRVEKASAIAEIVSSVAIVATLIYLGVETQQNTQALQVNVRQAAADAEVEWLYNLLNTPEVLIDVGPAVLEGQYDARALAATGVLAASLFRLRENLWLQYRSGALDLELWGPYRDTLADIISSNEVMKAQWEGMRGFYASGFQVEIDGVMQQRRGSESQ